MGKEEFFMKKFYLICTMLLLSFLAFNQVTITSDQIWTNKDDPDSIFQRSGDWQDGITITNGATLVIDCSSVLIESERTFEMRGESNITVDIGAKLIIENAIITCDGSNWAGIIVSGNPYAAQTIIGQNRTQGFLILCCNTKIENASTGVFVHGGGVILASGTTFSECTVSIQFEAYGDYPTSAPYDNLSFINNCHFYNSNDTNLTVNNPLNQFIYAQGISLRIEGCDFTYINDYGLDKISGIGIYCSNSKLVLRRSLSYNNIPISCQRNGQINTFENLEFGVYFYINNVLYVNSSPPKSLVLQSQFKNCRVGVYEQNSIGSHIYKCHFKFEDDFQPEGNIANLIHSHNQVDTPHCAGIVMYHSKNYKILENTFRWDLEPFGESSIDTFYSYGIVINNKQYQAPECFINDNTFTNYQFNNRSATFGELIDLSEMPVNYSVPIHHYCNYYKYLHNALIVYKQNEDTLTSLIGQGYYYGSPGDPEETENIFDEFNDNYDTALVNINTGNFTYSSNHPFRVKGRITPVTPVNSHNCEENKIDPCFFFPEPSPGPFPGSVLVDSIVVIDTPRLEPFRRNIWYYDSAYVYSDILEPSQKRIKENDSNDTKQSERLVIYPNPAGLYVMISYCLSEDNKGLTLTISDCLGKEVFHKNLTENSGYLTLNFNELKIDKGIYFITFTSEKKLLRCEKILVR